MKQKTTKSISMFFIYSILILWAITTIFPFIWVFVNSFKTSSEILNNSFSLPASPTFQNYINAFEKQNIFRAYMNSFLIAGSTMFFVLFFGSLASYALTRFNFKLKPLVSMLFLGSLMFPIFATIIPVFKLILGLNLINTHLGVILIQIAGNISFAIIVMMGFMSSLPLELEESAFLEGCNTFQIYYKIILPISRPVLSSVAIFTFLWSYNDLFTQIIILRQKESYTISALLNEISSQFGIDFGLMASAVVLVIIPVLIVYMFLQKNIIKGLTAGAVKG